MAAGSLQSGRVAAARPLSPPPAPHRRGARRTRAACSINLLPSSVCFLGGRRGPRRPMTSRGRPQARRQRASLVRAGPGAMAALGGDGLRLLSVSRPERQPESAALGGPGPGLCCWVSVFSCLSLACSYVGSLYVWKSELPRCGAARADRASARGCGRSLDSGGGVALAGGDLGP